MERKAEGNVIVIRRRVAASKDRHHGGAWKVAYADFATAMMAFFLLMWLLSVTDENTRLGLADYFSPTIPIHSTRGGGDGPFDGSSMFSQDVLARDETGQQGDPNRMDVLGVEQDQTLFEIAEELTQLPSELRTEFHARDYYGTLNHNVKAVYQRYLGWFDANPAHLHPLPPAESGRRYVELADLMSDAVA